MHFAFGWLVNDVVQETSQVGQEQGTEVIDTKFYCPLKLIGEST